ncbi:MAG: hypothetical protein R6V67_05515 [Spirochaetia bacterium]
MDVRRVPEVPNQRELIWAEALAAASGYSLLQAVSTENLIIQSTLPVNESPRRGGYIV